MDEKIWSALLAIVQEEPEILKPITETFLPMADFINQFPETDGRVTRAWILMVANKALRQMAENGKTLENYPNIMHDFNSNFEAIEDTNNTADTVRSAAYKAIELAFVVGMMAEDRDEILKELNRQKTELAREKRKARDINDIIVDQVTTLWAKKPSFRKNKKGTAEQIREPLRDEIAKLSNVPKEWVDPQIGTIRKRIERLAKDGRIE